MGTTKSTLFTAQQNRAAELAKAFSHPARVAILEHLIKINACVCGDLVEVLPLSQSTVSQHLKALKKIGILKGEIEGASTCYCINEEVWKEAKLTFEGLLKSYKFCC